MNNLLPQNEAPPYEYQGDRQPTPIKFNKATSENSSSSGSFSSGSSSSCLFKQSRLKNLLNKDSDDEADVILQELGDKNLKQEREQEGLRRLSCQGRQSFLKTHSICQSLTKMSPSPMFQLHNTPNNLNKVSYRRLLRHLLIRPSLKYINRWKLKLQMKKFQNSPPP